MTQEQFFKRYLYDRVRDRLGGGGFGNVYKVFDTVENEYIALKIAEVKPGQESLSLLKEVELASSLERHVNIARYSECYRFDTPTGIFDFGLLQYYPDGNLSQLIRKHELTGAQKEEIAEGLLSGIQHLHQNNIVHRDLKSSNILIARGYRGEYVPKIADFGLSKQFTENENSYFSNSFAGGSLLYVAPEQLEGKELRKNVDLWSLGVVLYELFTGAPPFRASVDDGSETARAEIIRNIKDARIPAALSTIPTLWQEVIKKCLVADPRKRIKSIEEILEILGDKTGIEGDNTEVDHTDPTPSPPKPPSTNSSHTWLYFLIGGLILAVGLILGMRSCGAGSDLEPELVKYEENGLYGYKDADDEVVIGARYEEAGSFSDGRARVWVSDSVYYIDNKGTIVEMIRPVEEGAEEGEDPEDQLWQLAQSSNTKASYNSYLRDYPMGRYASDARSKINEIESNERAEAERIAEESAWSQAERTNTKASYTSYLRDYPNGRYARDARSKISEIEKKEQEIQERQSEDNAWSQAEQIDTKSSYNRYLRDYPTGRYASDAKKKISEIESNERAAAERKAEEERRRQAAAQTPAQKAAAEIAATMVRIPGGTFTMGCTREQGSDCLDAEKPAHQVKLSGFSINKYEVTQDQWRAIMGSDPPELYNKGCDRCPVERVSWEDAQAFIRKLNNLTGRNYRLPTEAEWEYAARGGNQSRGYKYSGSNSIGEVAWFDGNAKQGNTHGQKRTTRPVGGKDANELGLYDMSGNVWEWCSDWFKGYPGNSGVTDRMGSGRVARGGSWNAVAQFCRVSHRGSYWPVHRYRNIGFRLAR